MTPQSSWRESDLSALFDDELMPDEVDSCLVAIGKNPALVDRLCDYQDLRVNLTDPQSSSSNAFLQGFRERLARAENQPLQVPLAAPEHLPHAANDAVFRWKLVAGLASCATVAVLAWTMVGSRVDTAPMMMSQASPAFSFASPYATQVVQGFSPALARPAAEKVEPARVDDGAVMLRDAALDEFLRAHGAQAGGMAIENTSGFMRNATFGSDGL